MERYKEPNGKSCSFQVRAALYLLALGCSKHKTPTGAQRGFKGIQGVKLTQERLRFGRESTVMLLDHHFTALKEEVFQCKTQPVGQGNTCAEHVLLILHGKVMFFFCHVSVFMVSHSVMRIDSGMLSKMLIF